MPDITKVLLVDEDRNFLALLKNLFQRAGYETATTTVPRAAIYSLDTFCPDIIITDFVMPEIRGDVLAETIKREVNAPVVIIMTALDVNVIPGGHKADGIICKDALLALLHYKPNYDELPPDDDDEKDKEKK